MKKERFLIVFLFIIVAVVCFFIIRAIDDYIYIRFAPDDLIGQFKYGFNLRLLFYGVYVLLLVAVSWGGFRISKRRGAIEYKKGFVIVSVISGVLLLVYLIAMLVLILG